MTAAMRDARIDLDFGDDTYSFRMAWGELIELQEKCDAGPFVIYRALCGDDWKVEYISQVIRLGLIGGTKDFHPVRALKLVRKYVEDRPATENLTLARAILLCALFGAPGEDDKKADASVEETEVDNGMMKMGDILGAAAVMGYTPQQVNEMTVYQFTSAFKGYVAHHTPAEAGKITSEEADTLWDAVQSLDVALHAE